MYKYLTISVGVFMFFLSQTLFSQNETKTNPPIYIAFHWHMHQPIYMPYETIMQTQSSGAYSFSLYDVFTSRYGCYTDWPKNAVQKGIDAGLPHLGAQVSFSGSLVENLNNLETAGVGFSGWKNNWNYITSQTTSLGNSRIDLVGFGYHHPLMGLIDYQDIRKSVQQHKTIFSQAFPSYTYSKGIFPPENAFSERMIPALADEGIQWAFVDNLHFERASAGCPVGDHTGVLRPNKADILNPDPGDWHGLSGVWMPSPVSMQWAHQPHYVQQINPTTGIAKKMIAVPTSRYLGNEDGRGGFGALNYEGVMSQMESYNTDTDHPMLIVLHHDGDNYGGGTDSYYGSNFQNFVAWLLANPSRFVCTTVDDYLEMFPPETSDLIHVQDGGWSGADNGDPEFKKWNGDPGLYMGTTPNYSPDRNSWAIITAAKNIVKTAEQINANSQDTKDAWKFYLNAQTSCYWYWDGTEMWDSHPARACNMATAKAVNVVNSGTDLTAPTIYVPQREPYNPGDIEWTSVGIMPRDFTVWTYVYDHAGLQTVKLKYRIDDDGTNDLATTVNETYAGGSGVGVWQEIDMTSVTQASITNPMPTYKANRYEAEIAGQESVLIDYYVEAVDIHGNIEKSDILHVWVSNGNSGSGEDNVSWEPAEPTMNDVITITATAAVAGSKLHWGVDNNGSWTAPIAAYYPAGTVWISTQAVQTPFSDPDSDGVFTCEIGPFNNASQVAEQINFVLKINESTWDNNGGGDYHISINNTPGDEPTSQNKTINLLIDQNYSFQSSDFVFNSTNGATFAGIKITQVETAGDLEYNGIDISADGEYSDVSNLVFKPAWGAFGSPYATFKYRVKDSNGLYSTASYTTTINIVQTNPTSGNSSVNLQIDETYTFSTSNFAFTSGIGASFAGIKLTSTPTVGTLTYNGASAGINTDYADVTKLSYTPASGATGSPYANFSFKVKDNQGNYSTNSYTLTINVIGEIEVGVSWYPENPTSNDVITVFVNGDNAMNTGSLLHWGVNGWAMPTASYIPAGSSMNGVPESPFTDEGGQIWSIDLGPFNNPAQVVNIFDFVIRRSASDWNNNGGADWHIPITQAIDISVVEQAGAKLSIYPNPMSDFAFIEFESEDYQSFTLSLYTISGQVLIETKIANGERFVLERNKLSAGIYFIEARGTNGLALRERLMIK